MCGLKFSGLQPSLLASGGNDNKLFVWDVRKSHTTSVAAAASSQQPVSNALHRFHEHTAAVKAIAWSPHAVGILGSGGGTQDKKLRFWNTGTGVKISELDTGSQVRKNRFLISPITYDICKGLQSNMVSQLKRSGVYPRVLTFTGAKSNLHMGLSNALLSGSEC